jgi:hypothetical protein
MDFCAKLLTSFYLFRNALTRLGPSAQSLHTVFLVRAAVFLLYPFLSYIVYSKIHLKLFNGADFSLITASGNVSVNIESMFSPASIILSVIGTINKRITLTIQSCRVNIFFFFYNSRILATFDTKGCWPREGLPHLKYACSVSRSKNRRHLRRIFI